MRYEHELIGLANEAWVSRCLHVVVDLGIADLVGDEAITFGELGSRSGADAVTLEAVLRVLARRGIFIVRGGAVTHSLKSRLLQESHPSNIAQIVGWIGSVESWNAFGHLAQTSRQRSGFELAFGEPMFHYLARNRPRQEAFGRSMEAFTAAQVDEVLRSVDLSPYGSILDLGGGSGILASAISEHYPAARVSIFDLPGVASSSRLKPPIAILEGDFFSDDIPPADLTVLMNVLHDWPDAEAARVLAAVRKANGGEGSVCVVESLAASHSRTVEMVNLGMVVMTGGRQRTRDEHQGLLHESGYHIVEEVSCGDELSALMAKPLSD